MPALLGRHNCTVPTTHYFNILTLKAFLKRKARYYVAVMNDGRRRGALVG
jgi:hypothetical protein